MHEASDGRKVRSCSREPPRGHQYLGRGQDATTTAWAQVALMTTTTAIPPSASGIPSRMRCPARAARLSPASGRAGTTDLHFTARIGLRRPFLTFRLTPR